MRSARVIPPRRSGLLAGPGLGAPRGLVRSESRSGALEPAILFVIDGGKALRRAIKDVFGEHALARRCHRHKERNVCDLLAERDRDQVRARMRAAWALTDAEHRDLAKLVIAIERHALVAASKNPDRHEVREPVTV